MIEARSRHTDVRGMRIHSIEEGPEDAPALILVHGLGASVTRWVDALPILAQRYRTIAIDLPGFGRSDIPRTRYTTLWLAGAVKNFMDARGIDRAVLAGNSLGGTVAMRLAARAPERCSALVLVGAAFPPVSGSRPNQRMFLRTLLPLVPMIGEAMYEAYGRLPFERQVEESLRAVMRRPDRLAARTRGLFLEEARERRTRPELRRALFSAHRAIAAELFFRRKEVWATAASIRVPTLLVWGEHDLIIPLAAGRHAAQVIPGAEIAVLDAGHVPQLETLDEFCDVVTAFVDRALKARTG